MKALSLIGIFLNVLGMVLCFAVVDNYVEYGDLLSGYLNLNHREIKHDVFNLAIKLDTGRNLCFVLMGLFIILLFICTKFYRSDK